MLKSTHKVNEPAPAPSPLPEGWTEHKAPTGHSYYYHAATSTSTYTRPTVQEAPQQPEPAPAVVPPNFADSSYTGDYQGSFRGGYGGRGGSHGRGGHDFQNRRRQQAEDRPKHKYKIPNCTPWILVKTKLGRRFVHNPDTNESFWKYPTEVMKGVIEFDRQEREKKGRRERGEPSEDEDERVITFENKETRDGPGDSDEYEEVEVTDEDEEDEQPSKKVRTDEAAQDQPVEFDEDDMAYQLKMMGEEYGLDPAEYGNPYNEELEEGAEGLPLTDEDCRDLFRDMLDDYGTNPYTPWETVVEEGRIVQDERYTVYTNMKQRKEAWSDWSKNKIQVLKEQRQHQVKQDPKIPFLELLQNHASPKLYWQEFKRKYRKEPEMRDSKLSDKDREKWYREHIGRLKLPSNTLKSDLTALLRSTPLSMLNRSTTLASLPSSILSDLRYISLASSVRDGLIGTCISTLPPAPDASDLTEEQSEEIIKKRAERERREKALADREKQVEDQKRRQQKELNYGRGRLRDEERELQRAMKFGKDGLRGQLDPLSNEGADSNEIQAPRHETMEE